MTYEELFLAVSKLTFTLNLSAVRLLHYLISTAITDGSNEVKATERALADSLKCSRDKVAEAVDALKPHIGVTTHRKLGHTFQLPAAWFSQARGLFTQFGTVENSAQWPGNQATQGE